MKHPHSLLVALLLCAAALLPACAGRTTPNLADSITAEQALDRMQGRWRSLDDPSSEIEIDGDRLRSIYVGEAVDTGTIDFKGDCRPTDGPDVLSFTVSSEDGQLCYYLVAVDDDTLEYSFAARGNTLRYRRAP